MGTPTANSPSSSPEPEKAIKIRAAISDLKKKVEAKSMPEVMKASEEAVINAIAEAIDPTTLALPHDVEASLKKTLTSADILELLNQFKDNGNDPSVVKARTELNRLGLTMPTPPPTLETAELLAESIPDKIKSRVTEYISAEKDSPIPGVQKILDIAKGFNFSHEQVISWVMTVIASLIEGFAANMPALADISGEIRYNELPMAVKSARLPPEEKERILTILKTPEAKDRFLDAYATWLTANSGEGKKAAPPTYKAALEKEVVTPAAPALAEAAPTEAKKESEVVTEEGINFSVKSDSDPNKMNIIKGDGIYSIVVNNMKAEIPEMNKVEVVKATPAKEAQIIFYKNNSDKAIIFNASTISEVAITSNQGTKKTIKSNDENLDILFQSITA